jgi:putative transposase
MMLNFALTAKKRGIKVLRTPSRTPRANAICERLPGSVRRECLDQFLVLHEKQFYCLFKAYEVYFSRKEG